MQPEHWILRTANSMEGQCRLSCYLDGGYGNTTFVQVLSQVNNAALQRDGRRFGAIFGLKFLHDMADVQGRFQQLRPAQKNLGRGHRR